MCIRDRRNAVEYAAAMGGVAFKPYVTDGRIDIDIIQADRFFPTQFDGSGNMTGCVFIDQFVEDKRTYTRLEHHEMSGRSCHIRCV